jgi:hypothetical protein
MPREYFRLDQARALISISVAGNLDVIPCQDADAPHKQPFGPCPGAITTTMAWATSLSGGSGVWTIPRLSTGNQQMQVSNTVHCYIGLQTPGHLFVGYNIQLHCGRSPLRINRAVVPPERGDTQTNVHSSTLY